MVTHNSANGNLSIPMAERRGTGLAAARQTSSHDRLVSMRTTLTIDDDVPEAARELASRRRRSLGEVISALSRQALRPAVTPSLTPGAGPFYL